MKVDVQTRDNLVVVTPEGKITSDDLQRLSDAVNGYINEYDSVPNLVIVAHEIPHWDGFEALKQHISFVRNHHQLIRKVAIVSDSALLWVARSVVDVFTGAKVRRFNSNALDDALNWAKMVEDHPGAILLLENLPRDVIGVRFTGLITSKDYAESLQPVIDKTAEQHDKLKLLVVLDNYFDGFSAGAMWDDMRFGMSHLATFSKIALVTDVEWIRKGAKLFGTLMPTELVVFDLDEVDDATGWIKT